MDSEDSMDVCCLSNRQARITARFNQRFDDYPQNQTSSESSSTEDEFFNDYVYAANDSEIESELESELEAEIETESNISLDQSIDSSLIESLSASLADQFNESEETAFEPDETLHESSEIKLNSFMTLLLSFIVKNNISKAGIEDLLKLIDYILPKPHKAPKSFYHYDKLIREMMPKILKVFVCSNCDQPRNSNQKNCANCPELQHGIERNNSTIHIFSVRKQIAKSIEKNQLSSSRSQESGVLSDFVGSPLYENLVRGQDNLITLSISTDGAPVTTQGKLSMWPVYGIINEIPIETRFNSENVILFGLWVGEKKPNMPLLLNLTLLQRINDIRISYNNREYKLKIGVIISDLPAKAELMSHIRFNGHFGCPYCEHPGASNLQNQRGMSYPFASMGYAKKDSNFYQRQWELILRGRNPEKGVKALSPLAGHIKFPDQFPIGYMHCILEGAIKKILLSKKWRSPRNLSKLNSILARIEFPHDCPRKLATIESANTWKATQYQLILFILPIFKNLYSTVSLSAQKFFIMVCLLVTGSRILLDREIDREDVELAERLFKILGRYLNDYFDNRLTINFHLITDHLCDQVRQTGPLTSTSEFVFEGFNKHLKDNVNGSRCQGNSISSLFQMNCLLKSQASILSADQNAHNLYLRSWSRNGRLNRQKIGATTVIGCLKEASNSDYRIISCFIDFISTGVKICHRILINEKMFHSYEYDRRQTSNSATCSFLLNGQVKYGLIKRFYTFGNEVKALIKLFKSIDQNYLFNNLSNFHDPEIEELINTKALNKHFYPCQPIDNEVLVPTINLIERFIVSFEDTESDMMYLCPWENFFQAF